MARLTLLDKKLMINLHFVACGCGYSSPSSTTLGSHFDAEVTLLLLLDLQEWFGLTLTTAKNTKKHQNSIKGNCLYSTNSIVDTYHHYNRMLNDSFSWFGNILLSHANHLVIQTGKLAKPHPLAPACGNQLSSVFFITVIYTIYLLPPPIHPPWLAVCCICCLACCCWVLRASSCWRYTPTNEYRMD